MVNWVLKFIAFIIAIIVLSFILDSINNTDRNLNEGDCVEIIIGNSPPIQGQIYNLRPDNRYTIHYLSDRGQHFVITLKRFQFRQVDCINTVIPQSE